jgi:hypothetical protein
LAYSDADFRAIGAGADAGHGTFDDDEIFIGAL